MNTFAAKLDRAGFNPRLMLLFFTFGTVVAMLVLPLFTHVDPRHSAGQCDLKELGNFPFDDFTGGPPDIPAWIRQLDGKQIALEGFISPFGVSGERLSHFQLVCNVATNRGPPRVQERVFVSVPKGKTVDYIDQEVRAFGKFHIAIDRDRDTQRIIRLFTMDLDRVEPL